MLAPFTYLLIRLSITFGYLTGGIPVRWNNQEQQIHTVTSTFDRIRWAATLFVSCWGTVIAYLTLRYYVELHGFFLSDEIVVIRTVVVFVTLISNLFNFNTAWNTHEFVSTLNNSLLVYRQFEIDLKFRGATRSKNWCNEIFALTFVFCVTLPPQVATLQLLRCDICILYGIVPDAWICSQSVVFSFVGFDFPTISLSMIFFAGVQTVYLSQILGSALLIIATWYPYLFYGLEIMNILNSRCLHGVSKQDFKTFRKTYRCFQILQKKINLCLGMYFMTGHMFLFSGLFVMAVTAIVKIKLTVFLALVFVGWTFIYLVHYLIILARLWKFSECTDDLLRHTRYHWNSPGGSKYLRPFKPLKICFGTFCDFDKNTYIFIGNFVLGLTINILLMEPNAHNQQMRF